MGGLVSASLSLVHVVQSLAPPGGGTSVSIPALCDALGGMGSRLRLHATNAGDSVVPRPHHYDLQIHRCLPLTGGGTGRLGISPGLQRALRAEARQADVVHSHGLWLLANLGVHWATRHSGVRVVLSPHGMLEPYAWQRSRGIKRVVWALGQESAVRTAHCIHATAHSEYESLRALGLTNPIAVVPNGVALPVLRPQLEKSRRRLLFLGRVDQKKGIDILIEAWSRVAASFLDWELTIVGPATGRYDRQMQQLARALDAPRVTFSDGIYGAARDELMATSDLFVLPTRSENFGMTVAEALAAEVPVICSKGAPWQGLEGEACGHWIDVGVEPLEAALKELLARPSENLREMGRRGRLWMQRDFSWEAQAAKMSEMYRWLLKRGPQPAHVRLH